MNLGTLSLLLVIFFFKIIYTFTIILPVSKCFPEYRKKYKDLKKELFFNGFYELLFEGYFTIVLCSFFNLVAPNDS